jgi:hypothetical protein
MCKQQNPPQQFEQEILSITELIIKQNYFRHQNKINLQNEGLAMGTPTSSLFSEIYIYNLEDSYIFSILLHHQIVDISDMSTTSLFYTPTYTYYSANSMMSPTLKFTIEEELDNNIKFLDISITKHQDRLSYSIHRKPPTTDTIIPSISCHPIQHKLASIHHLVNRRDSYQLNPTDKHMENMTIEQILHNNGYNSAKLFNFRPPKSKPKSPDTHKKWALFTYIGPETRFITKIFCHTSINIAFCTKNNSTALLHPTHPKDISEVHSSRNARHKPEANVPVRSTQLLTLEYTVLGKQYLIAYN